MPTSRTSLAFSNNILKHGSGRHWLHELSEKEHAQLIQLNEKLTAAEAWIHQRGQQCQADYFASGGVKNHRFNDNHSEDVHLEAKVICVLRRDYPGSGHDTGNVVAELDASMLFLDAWEEGFSFAQFGGAGHEPPLAGVRLCWLFHDLVDRVLKRNWDAALSISGLWTDVTLVQQRVESWV